ncbi:hypothetical protein ABTY53_13315 [Streptomyces noursei]|uniref:hypothetical protein n=1 Tax=Streptomyces noursei TaxID=1971 RepID=UPI003330AE40
MLLDLAEPRFLTLRPVDGSASASRRQRNRETERKSGSCSAASDRNTTPSVHLMNRPLRNAPLRINLAACSSAARLDSAGLLSAAVTTTLVLASSLRDLDTANQLAGVAGAILGAVGLAVSIYALPRTEQAPAAGARSVHAGLGVGRAVTGDRNRVQNLAHRQRELR